MSIQSNPLFCAGVIAFCAVNAFSSVAIFFASSGPPGMLPGRRWRESGSQAVTPPALTAAGCVALYHTSSLARLVADATLGHGFCSQTRLLALHHLRKLGCCCACLELLLLSCSAASIFCFASPGSGPRLCASSGGTGLHIDAHALGRKRGGQSIGVLTP